MISAKGYNGQVTFDGHFVTITRNGFIARTSIGKGEKRIPIGSITGVQWKSPGAVFNGFIQFTISGGNEPRSHFGSQMSNAKRDENSVVILLSQARAFEALRQAIEQAIALRQMPAPAPPSAPSAASIPDQIQQLAVLRDQGILTSQEFETKKAELLSRM